MTSMKYLKSYTPLSGRCNILLFGVKDCGKTDLINTLASDGDNHERVSRVATRINSKCKKYGVNSTVSIIDSVPYRQKDSFNESLRLLSFFGDNDQVLPRRKELPNYDSDKFIRLLKGSARGSPEIQPNPFFPFKEQRKDDNHGPIDAVIIVISYDTSIDEINSLKRFYDIAKESLPVVIAVTKVDLLYKNFLPISDIMFNGPGQTFQDFIGSKQWTDLQLKIQLRFGDKTASILPIICYKENDIYTNNNVRYFSQEFVKVLIEKVDSFHTGDGVFYPSSKATVKREEHERIESVVEMCGDIRIPTQENVLTLWKCLLINSTIPNLSEIEEYRGIEHLSFPNLNERIIFLFLVGDEPFLEKECTEYTEQDDTLDLLKIVECQVYYRFFRSLGLRTQMGVVIDRLLWMTKLPSDTKFWLRLFQYETPLIQSLFSFTSSKDEPEQEENPICAVSILDSINFVSFESALTLALLTERAEREFGDFDIISDSLEEKKVGEKKSKPTVSFPDDFFSMFLPFNVDASSPSSSEVSEQEEVVVDPPTTTPKKDKVFVKNPLEHILKRISRERVKKNSSDLHGYDKKFDYFKHADLQGKHDLEKITTEKLLERLRHCGEKKKYDDDADDISWTANIILESTDQVSFPCHRELLIYSMSYFRRMFEFPGSEKEALETHALPKIPIFDLDSDMMSAFLDYVYTRKIPSVGREDKYIVILIKIIVTAMKYLSDDLLKYAENTLKKTLTSPESICDIEDVIDEVALVLHDNEKATGIVISNLLNWQKANKISDFTEKKIRKMMRESVERKKMLDLFQKVGELKDSQEKKNVIVEEQQREIEELKKSNNLIVEENERLKKELEGMKQFLSSKFEDFRTTELL